MRQCDGGRVQCVVMIRDDFWMAATRFMRAVEVRLAEGENSLAVDLFEPRHAKRVLASFGRAFGTLPPDSAQTTRNQTAFLEQAIDDIAEDGKIVCVRLALFAEMMKGREWESASLQSVGGAQGVGAVFLEETFSARTAATASPRPSKSCAGCAQSAVAGTRFRHQRPHAFASRVA